MASTSLMTFAMALRDCLTYELHRRDPGLWELEGMAHKP